MITLHSHTHFKMVGTKHGVVVEMEPGSHARTPQEVQYTLGVKNQRLIASHFLP